MTPRKKRSDSGRMRPTTIDEICDRFAALPADGRDGLLLTLQQIDRVLRKREAAHESESAVVQKVFLLDEERRDLPLADARRCVACGGVGETSRGMCTNCAGSGFEQESEMERDRR